MGEKAKIKPVRIKGNLFTLESKTAAAAIATAAVARELCGFFNAKNRFCDSGDSF